MDVYGAAKAAKDGNRMPWQQAAFAANKLYPENC